MKKLLILIALFSLFSCKENIKEVQSEIHTFTIKRDNLSNDIKSLDKSKKVLENKIKVLNEEVKELEIYNSGRVPTYIIKLRLKQSHFSLSLKKHLKDAMNTVEFELPVSKEFYDSIMVGSDLVDDFRVGSFILHGSFGSWKVTVKEKYIK